MILFKETFIREEFWTHKHPHTHDAEPSLFACYRHRSCYGSFHEEIQFFFTNTRKHTQTHSYERYLDQEENQVGAAHNNPNLRDFAFCACVCMCAGEGHVRERMQLGASLTCVDGEKANAFTRERTSEKERE